MEPILGVVGLGNENVIPKAVIKDIVERLEQKVLEHAINGQQYGEDGFAIHEAEEQGIKKGIEIAIETI